MKGNRGIKKLYEGAGRGYGMKEEFVYIQNVGSAYLFVLNNWAYDIWVYLKNYINVTFNVSLQLKM